MNVMAYLAISPLINDCPNCGNSYVGNGEGHLILEDNVIERGCKCGFEFVYNVEAVTSKTKVKKAIAEALAQLKRWKQNFIW